MSRQSRKQIFIGLDDEIGTIDNKHLQYQLVVKKIYITNKKNHS